MITQTTHEFFTIECFDDDACELTLDAIADAYVDEQSAREHADELMREHAEISALLIWSDKRSEPVAQLFSL